MATVLRRAKSAIDIYAAAAYASAIIGVVMLFTLRHACC